MSKIFLKGVSAVFIDDYELEEEYELRDDDYIVADEDDEDENALWDDEDTADDGDDADVPPKKERRKRKDKATFADDNTDSEDAEAEQGELAQHQIALKQNIIDRLEADAREHPIEDDTGDEEPERKKLKREPQAEALARLEDAARTQRRFYRCDFLLPL